ncbi:MAG: NADH pyrophosphatase, partial [Sphingomonadaceae bacterium]|nr:NADH pyrophosphatase [Sphingomonadaceae bacterium]
SQPWPFPSQLMIGCHAIAENDGLTIDTTELEDARWFTRDEVADALANPHAEHTAFAPPPPAAIAHHLMQWWLEK